MYELSIPVTQKGKIIFSSYLLVKRDLILANKKETQKNSFKLFHPFSPFSFTDLDSVKVLLK